VDGCVFDLTSEQFGDTRLDYTNCPEQDRAVHFAKAEKRARYELLKERLFARRPALVPITMAHVERYGAIYAAAFSGPPWNDPWTEADAVIHVRELLETKTAYGLEYVMDGKVVGFLLGTSMLFHYGRTFEINDLAVDPAYQGRGIASALLERCKADMKERGIVELHLITSADGFLPGFYERHGFGREHEVILMGMEM
jgi:ribosomal protein S18 acetylase RimI-like enzyme